MKIVRSSAWRSSSTVRFHVPPWSGSSADLGKTARQISPRTLTYSTTYYVERIPSEIKGVSLSNGRLSWTVSGDAEHVYYRVYKNGCQTRSTVATSFVVDETDARYEVWDVDKLENIGR